MSTGFQAVQWNRTKIIYDAWLAAGVVAWVGGYMSWGAAQTAPVAPTGWIDLRLQALGTCAFIMLTLILCIGPAARLDRRFLPVLYNRRHFGVAMCLVAAWHGWSMIEWYLALDLLPSLLEELTKPASYRQFIGFPFKVLGMAALVILVAMAATSHDYWQKFLTPRLWKRLHMGVYLAYALVVMHMALGVLQTNRGWPIALLLFGSVALVGGLHMVAARREQDGDTAGARTADGWLVVGPAAAIPDQAAQIISDGTERIAVFRDGARLAAVTNLCAHQQGPLGEGRVIDGCITCPWHGYQYRLEDGCAPAPFTERLATFRLRLRGDIVEVDPRPLPPGTPAAITLGT